MKSLTLKTLGTGENGDLKVDYRKFLKSIVEQPVSGKGFAVDEVRKAIKVIEVLEKAEDVLELEDADFEFMYSQLINTKFVIAHKNILQLINDVEAAKNS